MRLLLDTQIALWWLMANPRLNGKSRELIGSTECVISVVSALEVAIKNRIGKLAIGPQVLLAELRAAGAIVLPISDSHANTFATLPKGHADPFDLLLVAVAVAENLKLVTADTTLGRYAAKVPHLYIERV